jgi:ribosomal protein S8
MSLVNLAHVCSHMQNASLARLGLTSIPLSRMHLSLSLLLQKQGFLSTVTLGGPTPPAKLLPPTHADDITPASATKPIITQEVEEVTQQNRATRRLWLGMKYWDGEPVLRKMTLLSKPTKRMFIRGLRQVGECIFVSTDKGIMEARECVERKIGGQVLCRVW